MSHAFEKLPNEPIVLYRMPDSYDPGIRDSETSSEVLALLDAQAEPVYYVVDLLGLHFDMDKLITGANAAIQLHTAFRHPKVRQPIILSNNPAIQMAVKGMSSTSFGNMSIEVFESLDAAIAYIHGQNGK